MRKIRKYPIDQSPLYLLKSKKKLSELLGVSQTRLVKLSKSDSNYKIFTIYKNNKPRRVEVPKKQLEIIHKRLFNLLKRIETPEYLHSGVKKRSHVTNASAHTGCNELAKIDIKSFYPSTERETIYQFFRRSLLCSPDVSKILTDCCTVNNHIPTGSQISQVLAFHANKGLFDKIENLSRHHDVTFTCYVDDLSFSGNTVSPAFLWEVKKLIFNHGYKYHKEYRYPRSRVKVVTGVAIKDNQALVLNSHHKSIHMLREKLKNNEISKPEINSLIGMLNSASQLNRRYGKLSKTISKIA